MGNSRHLMISVLAVSLFACGHPTSQVDTVAYQHDIENWQTSRAARLTREDGWTTLVGLFWLKPGDNRFGRAPDNTLALDVDTLPAHVGAFTLADRHVTFTAAPGAGVLRDGKPVTSLTLVSDAQGDPTVLTHGTLSFYVVERAGHVGLRVRDSVAPARVHFQGLRYFPIAVQWRFEARFEPYRPMKKIPIINVLGMEEDMDSPGALVFEVDGKPYRLDAVLEEGETDYFVMFGDRTNGRDTYGAGRFMYVKPPVNGITVLDFNKSYNPPCAFSPFATCPLPPPQNRLPFAVTAGELRYDGDGH